MRKSFKLGREINLLTAYPNSSRSFEERASSITIKDRLLARRFDKEYFDGNRNQGYGGYNYHPRFWQGVVRDIQKFYKLNSKSKVLDVGASKGFMLHDLKEAVPGISVHGVDISKYAILNAMPDIKPDLSLANAKKLPFADNSFDLVISLNTIHNLPLEDCFQALKEIERVSIKDKYIVVDAWNSEEQRQKMSKWVITGLTCLSVSDWKKLFKMAYFTGDFYWFMV